MSEFGPTPSEMGIEEPQVEIESIYDAFDSKAFIPEKPLVTPQEGFHLRVEPDDELPAYFEENSDISKTIKPFLLALAGARSVFGSAENPEEYHAWSQWVNVHLLPRFGGQKHLQFEVVGRNARGETWAQPIDYPKTEDFDNQPSVVIEEAHMFQRELPKNAVNIANETGDVILFRDEDIRTDIQTNDKTIFRFGNYEVMAAKANPHVEEGGLHLWINSNLQEKAEGVQSNIKNGVEQFIIASAVAKSLYKKLGRAIEIHFSGNWGLPIEGHWKENLSAHANLYAAPSGVENVELPPRPQYQRPEIPESTREEMEIALRENMQELLTPFANKSLMEIVK
jgi:hypothetical protein